MSHDHSGLIAQFKESLTQQRYNPVAVHNYCRYATYFLRYLAEREISIEAVTPTEVSSYLRCAARRFRRRHGRSPRRFVDVHPKISNSRVIAARAEKVAT